MKARRADLVSRTPGRLLHEDEGGGVWLRQASDRFARLHADEGRQAVRFRGLGDGPVRIDRDGAHLIRKEGNTLERWHRDDGCIARAEVPPRPPSPYAMDRGRPQWDGWWPGRDGHLWYLGYDPDGRPLVYLFDARTLALLDTAEPRSSLDYPRPEFPERIPTWGDFAAQAARPFPAEEPIGFFANGGDKFAFFVLYEGRDGAIVDRSTPELEERVREASDERVFFVELVAARSKLLTCDDLGLFGLIDVEKAAWEQRVVQPLEPLQVEDDRIAIDGCDARPARRLFQCRDVVVDATRAFLQMEVDPYALEEDLETLGDFPRVFLLSLDASTLRTLEVVTVAAESGEDVTLLRGGLIAVSHGEEIALHRW